MKYSAFAPVLLVSGLAFAQAPTEGEQPTAKKAEFRIKAEVVSSDASAKTITVQKATGKPESTPGMPDKPRTGGTPAGDKPTPVTLSVDAAAAASLGGLKAGDVVELTCSRTIGPDTAAPGTPGSTSSAPGSAPGAMAGIGAGDTPRSLAQCDKVTAISKS
jgi:hypothetical protein